MQIAVDGSPTLPPRCARNFKLKLLMRGETRWVQQPTRSGLREATLAPYHLGGTRCVSHHGVGGIASPSRNVNHGAPLHSAGPASEPRWLKPRGACNCFHALAQRTEGAGDFPQALVPPGSGRPGDPPVARRPRGRELAGHLCHDES
eukprot:7699481-Pyramimonas_sp.AAC.1